MQNWQTQKCQTKVLLMRIVREVLMQQVLFDRQFLKFPFLRCDTVYLRALRS